MSYTLKYNRSSYHIAGIDTRTHGLGRDTGNGAVSYYAESSCPSLTRGRFCDGPSFTDLAEAIAAAKVHANAYGMKFCKHCENAAEAAIED